MLKLKLFSFCFLVFILGCKDEPYEPRLNLFLTFERDNIEYRFEGDEVRKINPFFSSHFSKDNRIFTLESWCGFTETKPEAHDVSFYVDFMQIDTSDIFSESGLDSMFSEGIKNLGAPDFTIIPSGSIFNFIFIKYRTAFPVYNTYRHGDCDNSDQNYFEITKSERKSYDGKVYRVIIEANFDLSLCTTNGDKLRFENGKLRFYYNIDIE